MSAKLEALLSDPSRKMNAAELEYLAACFRKTMFTILHERGTGHWGGASSAAELVTALYFNRLRIKSDDPEWEDRDRFVLSKGHASVNLYTVLASRGFFSRDLLPSFRTLGSILQGHPAMNKVPGVDMSTGALGHGLSVGLGMALSRRLSSKNYWTYVMTGEGCLDEGSSWEAMLAAAKYKPEGLVLMIDYNKVQLDGTEKEILSLEPLGDKLKAFGWHIPERTYSGHDAKEILASFEWMDSDDIWPKAVIYDTVKGKGVDFSEGQNAWHGAAIDDEHFKVGIVQLEADVRKKEELV